MRRLLSGGAMGVLSLAMLLPVIAPCLCPADVGTGTDDCCPSPKGFEAALAKSDCCVARRVTARIPRGGDRNAPGSVRRRSRWRWPSVTADFRIIAQSPPQGAPLPAAATSPPPPPHLTERARRPSACA